MIFFDYSIENLSDGETAYLGFFASLYEQVSLLTPNKEKYIILLDEPESRMHPELTRNFIDETILFFKGFK
ncbi:AAA family ATPase [Bacillus cereus]